MKLIIDIDEELYKNVIEHTKEGYIGSDVWIAVAKGKPYEERPTGDLISREALKETLSDKDLITWAHEYGDAIPLDWLMSAIDNAPTVEPCYQTTSCLDCKMYDKEKHNCPRFCEVIREIAKENQRPQGEWVWSNNRWGLGDWLCNKCEHYAHDKSNFCPNCGADMRGKEK